MSLTLKGSPCSAQWVRAMESSAQTFPPRSKSNLDMNRLNERQQRAVRYPGSNPLMILAAPGSGKTATLTMRIAYLIDEMCISPSSILAVTFTRKAADEMKTRIQKILTNSESLAVQTSNFHQLCLRIIRSQHRHCGFTVSPKIVNKKIQLLIVENSLKIFKGINVKQEQYDWEEIGSTIVAELQKHAKKQNEECDAENSSSDTENDDDEGDRRQLSGRSADYYVNFVQKAKQLNEKPSQYDSEHAFVLQAYSASLKHGQMMDLDDFVPITVRLFQENPKILEIYQRQWTHVLVDEFQDVSPNQFELVMQLHGEKGNLTVCGDEDQSIFGFRCGSSHIFRLLESRLPNIETIILNQTYRSTPQIISAADSLIRFNSKRTEKNLTTKKGNGDSVKIRFCYDNQAEIRDIVTQILHYHNDMHMELCEIAVLCRVKSVLKAFTDAFRQADIPFEYVQDETGRMKREKMLPKLTRRILAFCKLLYISDHTEQQFHEAFFDVIKGSKGIGKKTIDNIKEQLDYQKNIIKATSRLSLTSRPSVKQKLTDFVFLIKTLQSQSQSLSVLQSIELIGSLACSSADSENVEMKKLMKAAKEADFHKLSLDAFCHKFRFDQETSHDKNSDQQKNRVSLSTIHQAKGKEWECVFVVCFNEGTLPLEKIADSDGEHTSNVLDNSSLDHYEEERRICYVALTRAKSHLYLSYVKYNHKGQNMVPSRFLDELPRSIEFWEPKGGHKILQRRFSSAREYRQQLPLQENVRNGQNAEKTSMWNIKHTSEFHSASTLLSNGPTSQTNSNTNTFGFQAASSLLISQTNTNPGTCGLQSGSELLANGSMQQTNTSLGMLKSQVRPVSQHVIPYYDVYNGAPTMYRGNSAKYSSELEFGVNLTESRKLASTSQHDRNHSQGQQQASLAVNQNFLQSPPAPYSSGKIQDSGTNPSHCQQIGPPQPNTSSFIQHTAATRIASNRQVAPSMRNQETLVESRTIPRNNLCVTVPEFQYSSDTSNARYSSNSVPIKESKYSYLKDDECIKELNSRGRSENQHFSDPCEDLGSPSDDSKWIPGHFGFQSNESLSDQQQISPRLMSDYLQPHRPFESIYNVENIPEYPRAANEASAALKSENPKPEVKVERADVKVEQDDMKVEGTQLKRKIEASGPPEFEVRTEVKTEGNQIKSENFGDLESQKHATTTKVIGTQVKRQRIPGRSSFLSFAKPKMRSL